MKEKLPSGTKLSIAVGLLFGLALIAAGTAALDFYYIISEPRFLGGVDTLGYACLIIGIVLVAVSITPIIRRRVRRG